MTSVIKQLMTKFTAWIDPKLEKYRPKKKPFRPDSKTELIKVLHRTSQDVLTEREREMIAGAMSFPVLPVSSIAMPAKKLTFLKKNDFLGPLKLDELYKTGMDCFPVLDDEKKICGLIRISQISAMNLTEDSVVSQYLDKNVCFARPDYTLEMLLATFLRSNNNFCLLVDHSGEICGCVTLADLMKKLFGAGAPETFEDDSSLEAVAKRQSR